MNVAGNNAFTSAGDISLVEGGDQYVIQAYGGTLALYNIKNNAGASFTTPRNVTLLGGSNGEVTGVIGGGTNSNPITITKDGSGIWTFSNANTYTGATTIKSGNLVLSSTGSINNSASVDVQGDGLFDASAVAGGYTLPGTQKLMGSGTVKGNIINGAGSTISPGPDGTTGTLNLQNNLTLGNVSGGKLKFDLANNTTPANNDLLSVAGNLSILGAAGYTTFDINLLNGQLATGTYKLISYGGTYSGSVSNVSLGALGSGGTTRQTFSLSDTTPKEIDMIVFGTPASLVWKGNISNTWDRNPAGTLNWLNGGSADKYYDLDNVTFDSTGAAQPIVNISGDWTPGSIVVNAGTDYTFSGTGSIGGGTSMTLSKSGAGKLIIKNTGTNTFGGATTINGGVLQIGDGATAGAGGIGAGGVVNNAALVLNRPDDLSVVNAISGTGSVEKKGAGVVTLSGSNSYGGQTTVSAGTLKAGSGTALGATTGGTTIANGATLDVNSQNLGAEIITVQGGGVGGNGAIISTGAAAQQNALQRVTLAGDTTFGGSGRWDIRGTGAYLLGNYSLTKTGSNTIFIVDVGATGLANIAINQGALGFQGTTTMGDAAKTVTVASGATLGFYNTGSNILYKNLILQGGMMGTPLTVATNPGTSNFGGPVTLDGGGTINVYDGGTVIVSGSIGGTGMLTKTGTAGTVVLTGAANSWNGGTTIDGGTLQIGDGGANGSLPATGTIATNGPTAGSILSFNTASNITVSSDISGTGRIYVRSGTGIVTLSGNNTYDGSSDTASPPNPTLIGTSNVSSGGILRAASSTALGTNGVRVSGGVSDSRLELAGGITLANPTITIEGRQYMGGYNLMEPTILPHILNVSGNNTFTGDVSFDVWGVNYAIQSNSGSKLTLNSITYNISSTSDRYLQLRGDGNGEVTGAIANGSSATGPIYLTKDGSGTWTLSGYNTYTGPTIIKAGTLALGPSAYLITNSSIEVKAGATFDVSAVTWGIGGFNLYSGETLAGSGTVLGNVTYGVIAQSASTISPGSSIGTLSITNGLTLSGSGTLVYELTNVTTPGSGVNDLLNVSGTLTLTDGGTTDVVIHPSALSIGTYRLINCTNKGGSGGFNLVNTTRYAMNIDNTPANQVNLKVTGGAAKSLTWTGLSGNAWDVISSSNWTDGSDQQFYNADQVKFDASTTNNTVQIDTAVYPGSVTVDGVANYTFTGTGKISGLTGLTKKGTGTLTINTTNDYSGQTKVEDGILDVTTGSIGNNSAVLVTGGTLRVGNIRAGQLGGLDSAWNYNQRRHAGH